MSRAVSGGTPTVRICSAAEEEDVEVLEELPSLLPGTAWGERATAAPLEARTSTTGALATIKVAVAHCCAASSVSVMAVVGFTPPSRQIST